MGLVEVEPGVQLHVQDLGVGPPVVLIAGFGLSHEVWDGEVRELADAGYRAICIDLRGTGGSDKPLGGYDLPRLSADVRAVLAELDLTEVTLVGWSFGAQISLHVAATEPQRLARLALIGSNAVRASASPDFPFGADAEKALRSLVRAERLKRLDYRETVIRGGFATDPGDNTIGFLVRTQLQMPSWAAIACYESYLLTDLIDLVGEVRLPVLQIVGDSDATTPLEGSAWLQERLHDGQLTVLGECGHYPMLETPAAFREALLGFVSGRQSASASA